MTGGPSRAELIAAVAARVAKADRTEYAADLDAAADALHALLAALEPDDPIGPRTLATLGSVRRRQWALGRRPDGLAEAIGILRTAASAATADRALCLANLGNTLLTRGDAADLDEAIEAFTEAVTLTVVGTPTWAPYLVNLGAALTARARQRHTSADLDRGIAAIDAALAAAAAEDPRRPGYQVNLASALRTRFGRTYDPADIDRAITAARSAVAAQPSAPVLATLGGALLSRCETTGDVAELAEAIRYLADAMQATPERHVNKGRRMAGLAAALRLRAEITNDPTDLERAEALLLTAARTQPDGSFAVNLSAVLIRRAELTDDDALLDRAVMIAREADRTNLVTALHLRAARTGDLTVLDEAVAVAEAAVRESMPGSAERVGAVANLATVLQTRYLRTGHGADLQAAVDAARTGVDGTVRGDPELPGRLSNLGNVLRLRGVRSRSQSDLDGAVTTLASAVRLARFNRAGHLSNLGAAMLSRAEICDGDATQALPVLRQAVALIPSGSPHRPLYLSNLGNALVNAGDPSAAVPLHREALGLLPAGHPDRSVILGNLASALTATGDENVMPEVIRVTRELAEDSAASGLDRLLAAWRLADLEIRQARGETGAGADAMRTAVELADRVAWIGVTPLDRAYTLARFSTVAMDAAATLVHQDPAAAIAVLESGRAVGWREQLDQRRFDAITSRAPALADRLRAVGVALDRPLAV